MKTTLGGGRIEAVKVPAQRMLTAPNARERRTWYRLFVKELRSFLRDGDSLEQIQGLQGLERLERLQGLQGLERLQGLEVSKRDYRDVEVPAGATVYADPPYRATGCKAYEGFNHKAFDAWLAQVDFPVFVSEYTCPDGCVEVASRVKQCSMSANGKSQKAVEKVFVQARFAERVAIDEKLFV